MHTWQQREQQRRKGQRRPHIDEQRDNQLASALASIALASMAADGHAGCELGGLKRIVSEYDRQLGAWAHMGPHRTDGLKLYMATYASQI